jgi:hypothetical protein
MGGYISKNLNNLYNEVNHIYINNFNLEYIKENLSWLFNVNNKSEIELCKNKISNLINELNELREHVKYIESQTIQKIDVDSLD